MLTLISVASQVYGPGWVWKLSERTGIPPEVLEDWDEIRMDLLRMRSVMEREIRKTVREWTKFMGVFALTARLNYLKQNKPTSKVSAVLGRLTSSVTDADIERARGVCLVDVAPTVRGKVACPFHEGTSPVWIKQGQPFGFCFVCHKKVDAIAYVMRVEGLSFLQAVRKLA